MSAVLSPFASPVAEPPSITFAERAQAAAWAAQQNSAWGGTWWVETHLGEDGEVWLGVVTPSSLGRTPHSRTLRWLISREAASYALTSMPSGKTVCLAATLAEALATIERDENAPRVVAAGRGRAD